MGNCSTRPLTPDEELAKKLNNMLDNDLSLEAENDLDIKKLLLLGAGESGKSTLFKQAISIFGILIYYIDFFIFR